MANISRGFHHDDPIAQYCAKLTEKLEPIEKELQATTIEKRGNGRMLSAPEILQFGKNFIQFIGAKRVLDIGTFTGSSALAWALAVPSDGEVISMDVQHETLNAIGKPIIDKRPEISKKIKFELRPATETLDNLIEKGEAGKFDFAFIDADKINYPIYYTKSMELLRPGGVIFVDNALWHGKVVTEPDGDDDTRAIVKCNDLISNDPASTNVLINVKDGLHIVFKK